MSKIPSPDDAVLYACSKLQAVLLRMTGANPLNLVVWPACAATAVSGAAALQLALAGDAFYALHLFLTLLWGHIMLRGHRDLIADSRKSWDASLYKKYLGKSAEFRARPVALRYLFVGFAAWLSLEHAGMLNASKHLSSLDTFQHVALPMLLWGLAWFIYMRSAEPPRPDDGDFYARPNEV